MLRKHLTAALLCAGWLAAAAAVTTVSSESRAQIVNVQPLLGGTDDGFTGQFKGAVDWRTGNVDLFTLKTSLLLRYKTGMNTLISMSKAELGIKSGEEYLETVFSHLRWQWSPYDYFTWELYAQVATDRFRRIAIRGLAGTGPRFNIIEGPAVGLAVALSYLFEYQSFNAESVNDPEHNHRLSLYVTGKFRVDPLLSIVHTTYYQPVLTAFADDFNILSETDLAIHLKQAKEYAVSLVIGLTINYDHYPPRNTDDGQPIDSLDTRMDVAVAVGF